MSKSENDAEVFAIYYKGHALKLKWDCLPPLCRSPAVRLCSIAADTAGEDVLLLLTADNCLYKTTLAENKLTLHLQHQRNDIVDVDYCRGTKELFIVNNKGVVLKQRCQAYNYHQNGWQTVSFDPLELSEEGVCIRRVCCSMQGVVFITNRDDVYVLGSCGEVFSTELLPIKMRLIEEGKQLLDVCAGDDFFVMLLSNVASVEHVYDTPAASTSANIVQIQHAQSTQMLTRQNTLDIDLSLKENTKLDQMSRASVQSLSSKSDLTRAEQSFSANVQEIFRRGQQLLYTQVYTFGAVNNGLLGMGDHIKRATVNNLQKLDSIGVCSISAGREHTVARTLDGRLYHWGLNSKQQLNSKTVLTDLSAPTELKLDNMSLETQQRCVLEAFCGDFETILLNSQGTLQTLPEKLTDHNKTFLKVQFGAGANSGIAANLHLLLVSGAFTLQNLRNFQQEYHKCLTTLQAQLQLLLKYSHIARLISMWQKNSNQEPIKAIRPTCANYERLLCLLAAVLHSVEGYYRADFENAADLLFVQFHRECIELFECYSTCYCDIYSIDGFTEASRIFSRFASGPLLSEYVEEADLARVFQKPLEIFPVFIEFLQLLLKVRPEFKEHLSAWNAFAQKNLIYLELAQSTNEFWSSHERNERLRKFRRRHRRVILTSSSVPLKLSHSLISSTSFVLFSDYLCQVGSTLHMYPLCAIWLKIESDTVLRIITPEKSFTVSTRTNMDKKLWHDQLETSIVAALGRPAGTKLPNVRQTLYTFSRDHNKYANVRVLGSWRQGLMHGNCQLEYPDGRAYYGELHNGEIEGFGKMVIPSVGIYEGHFKASKFHGHGIFELKDDELYDGNFRDGLYHGHGMMRSPMYTYIGEYQANMRSGYGVLDDLVTGDKYMGMFADNKRSGAGTCVTMGGDYFEGNFMNDELVGTGIAVFENDYYYEGELNKLGPNGKGTYYMPNGTTVKCDEPMVGADDNDECYSYQLIGNVLSGSLFGNWQDVRIQTGSVAINRQFSKYPKSIGELIVDNNRKWRSLFDNFEAQILDSAANKKVEKGNLTTEQLWRRIAVFMHTQRERHKTVEQQEKNTTMATRSYFAKNIALGFASGLDSLMQKAKTNLLELTPKRMRSQEKLCDPALSRTGSLQSINVANGGANFDDDFSVHSNRSFLEYPNDLNTLHSSYESLLNSSCESFSPNNNNNNNNSFASNSCTQNALEYVPSFGITTFSETDIAAMKEYLEQAFKDQYHPLYLLNQRVGNCFYYSYGCWKVKPTPILAKQAMREWESISKRMYKFVRRMFPALPEDYCVIENTREVVSHITLLYPIVLSEGIYSTLFVLYANKYSRKDEMYRQNLIYADKLNDNELTKLLGLESTTLAVIGNEQFATAIQTLRQLKEKFSPKAMLTVIECCMQQLTDAYKIAEREKTALLTADSMMPLTVFIVLRAAVPHLGAELALLDDLTGGANFQAEMSGLAGYCYTTLKASYEHVTAKSLQRAQ